MSEETTTVEAAIAAIEVPTEISKATGVHKAIFDKAVEMVDQWGDATGENVQAFWHAPYVVTLARVGDVEPIGYTGGLKSKFAASQGFRTIPGAGFDGRDLVLCGTMVFGTATDAERQRWKVQKAEDDAAKAASKAEKTRMASF